MKSQMNNSNNLDTKSTRTASEAFFLLLSTELGINPRKLPTTSIENNNPNERRRGTANLTRSSDASESGLRDDHHTHISDNDTSWSEEAPILYKMLHNNKTVSLFDCDFLFSFFKTLRLVKMKIVFTDDQLLHLTSLHELSLSGNLLTSIVHLPPSLHILHAYANNISYIPDTVPSTLQHLGLGYNCITSLPPSLSFSSGYGALLSLDLSHNKLSSFNGTVTFLTGLTTLKHLCLIGNPIFLLPQYRSTIVTFLPWLNVLDDTPITLDERKGYRKDVNLASSITSGAQPVSGLSNIPEVFSLAFCIDYVEGSVLASFVSAENPAARQRASSPPTGAAVTPSAPAEPDDSLYVFLHLVR